jgi:hypothetical protein
MALLLEVHNSRRLKREEYQGKRASHNPKPMGCQRKLTAGKPISPMFLALIGSGGRVETNYSSIRRQISSLIKVKLSCRILRGREKLECLFESELLRLL